MGSKTDQIMIYGLKTKFTEKSSWILRIRYGVLANLGFGSWYGYQV